MIETLRAIGPVDIGFLREIEMSLSEDPSQVDTETLVRSRDQDLEAAKASPNEHDRLLWLRQAVNTQHELARREQKALFDRSTRPK